MDFSWEVKDRHCLALGLFSPVTLLWQWSSHFAKTLMSFKIARQLGAPNVINEILFSRVKGISSHFVVPCSRDRVWGWARGHAPSNTLTGAHTIYFVPPVVFDKNHVVALISLVASLLCELKYEDCWWLCWLLFINRISANKNFSWNRD